MSLFMKALCQSQESTKKKEPLSKRYTREYFYGNENMTCTIFNPVEFFTANVVIGKQMKPQGELKTTLFVIGNRNQ